MTVSVPVRLPLAVGVKTTLMAQVAPTLSVDPQLLLCAKSPVVLMAEMVMVVSPLLVRVNCWPGALLPTFAGEKVPLPVSVALVTGVGRVR